MIISLNYLDNTLELASVHSFPKLEVADRQLRSSRQFLEEQATERDLEIEELVRVNEKLKEELKEKEGIVLQHSGLQKEVKEKFLHCVASLYSVCFFVFFL